MDDDAKKALQKVEQEIRDTVVAAADGALTFTLAAPIERKPARLEQVIFHRPKVRDLGGVDMGRVSSGDYRAMVPLLSAVSELSREELEAMDVGEFMFIATACALRFLRRRPAQLARADG